MAQNGPGEQTSSGGPDRFEKTHWTLIVAAARDPADTSAHDALSRLCEIYRNPLCSFVRRHNRCSPEDAEDLTQSFFVHLLQKNTLASADPAKGTFRSFLLTCLKNFLANEREKQNAAKRNPGAPLISIDADTSTTHAKATPAENDSPDKIYERDCAIELVDQGIARLRGHYKARGKIEVYEALYPWLMQDPDAESYTELAGRLNSTKTALRMEVSRMRKKLRERLEDLIAPVGSSPAEIEAELEDLLHAFSR